MAISSIPLLLGQNFFPFLVPVTHCQIVFLYWELLCQELLDKFEPQNPHSNRQEKAYFLLNLSLLPFFEPTVFLFLTLLSLIACALSKSSSLTIPLWWSFI